MTDPEPTATLHGIPMPPLKQLAYWQEITSALFQVRHNLMRHVDEVEDPVALIQSRLEEYFEGLPEDIV